MNAGTYIGMSHAVFHWAEGQQDFSPKEGHLMSRGELVLFLARKQQEWQTAVAAGEMDAACYFKVKATIVFDDGHEVVNRFDVQGRPDTIDINPIIDRYNGQQEKAHELATDSTESDEGTPSPVCERDNGGDSGTVVVGYGPPGRIHGVGAGECAPSPESQESEEVSTPPTDTGDRGDVASPGENEMNNPTVHRAILTQFLTLAKKIINKARPITRAIGITTDGGLVYHNLTQQLMCNMGASQEIACVLDIEALQKIMRALPKKVTEIEFDVRAGGKVKVGPVVILGESPDEYPIMKFMENDVCVGYDWHLRLAGQKRVLKAFDDAIMATAVEKSRFAFNGIQLNEECLAATDGKRLVAVFYGDAHKDGYIEGPASWIVPLAAMKTMRDIVAKDKDALSVGFYGLLDGFTAPHVRMTIDAGPHAPSFTLLTPTIEGSFPKYKAVIPNETQFTMTTKREALQVALDLAKTATSQETRSVTITPDYDDNTAQVTGKSLDKGEASIGIDCKFDGVLQGTEHHPAERIAFNPDFLMAAIKRHPEESVVLQMNAPNRPVKIVTDAGDDTYRTVTVVMPVTTRNG